jgi:hypothetical protein
MHPNHSPREYQQRRVHTRAANTDSYDFFNLLTSSQLLNDIESLLPDHRERLFPPTETLSMFLAQALSADRSCQKAVNETAIKRLAGGLAGCSTRTGAYCQARKRLPTEMVSALVHRTGQLITEQAPNAWHYQNHPVRLVDGTTVSMLDTPANQESFPQPNSQKPGLGFPLSRVVALICLGSGAVLNAAIGGCQGKGSDEQSLLRTMLDTLNSGDILLGDAYYASYFLLCELQRRNVNAVFEQQGARKRSTDFRRGQRLGQHDHMIVLCKPKIKPDWMSQEHYESAPETLTVRELKTGNKILVTTLLCPKQMPKAALKEFYRNRWHVELDLRNIKTTLGMEVLSCKTPEMVIKEIWVYLLAYNLIRLIMAQSAMLADKLPRELSFKHTLQRWVAWNQRGMGYEDDVLSELFALIAQQRVGNRPGRIEPRAIKRRPKPYSLLTRPRDQARAEVKKNGHPKKLK